MNVNRRVTDFCEFITKIKHGNHSEDYRNTFIKYYYYGLFHQYKNWIKDYVIKNKYKIIDYPGEFGTELKYVIPFAYWHFKNGTLKKTISSKSTKVFYYFSENHEEKYDTRIWRQYFHGIPNSEDHNIKYNFRQWRAVPYKDKFKNDLFIFDKPILLIANKYNIEWGEPPVNYLNTEILRWIFEHYSHRYQIIYNRPKADMIVNDESDILHFGDYDLIENEYQEVINMQDMYNQVKCEKIQNYNQFQLMLYANTEHFISIHGGPSVLASYFGGVNIIYSVKGFEHYFGEFENFYPRLSGAKILHAKSNQDVIQFMYKYF